MGRKSYEEKFFDEELLSQVAFMKADRRTNAEISQCINVPLEEVNDYVIQALERSFLSERKAYLYTDPDKDRQERTDRYMRLRYAEAVNEAPVLQAMQQAGIPIPSSLRIFHSTPQAPTSPADWDHAVEAFARNGAAQYCFRLLQQCTNVGTAWGRTLLALVREMKAVSAALRQRHPRHPEFFPVWGAVIAPANDVLATEKFKNPDEWSSSSLATELNILFQGGVGDSSSLRSVPGLIPFDLQGGDLQAIWKFVKGQPGWQRIFDQDGLIHKTDAMFMSLGSYDQPDRWLAGAFGGADVCKALTEDGVVGDLGGCLITKDIVPPNEVPKGTTFGNVMERWTGVRYDHIQQCAHRGREQRKGYLGTTCFCVGPTRARILRVCLEQQLINRLVMDQHLAQELVRLLREDPDGRRITDSTGTTASSTPPRSLA